MYYKKKKNTEYDAQSDDWGDFHFTIGRTPWEECTTIQLTPWYSCP